MNIYPSKPIINQNLIQYSQHVDSIFWNSKKYQSPYSCFSCPSNWSIMGHWWLSMNIQKSHPAGSSPCILITCSVELYEIKLLWKFQLIFSSYRILSVYEQESSTIFCRVTICNLIENRWCFQGQSSNHLQNNKHCMNMRGVRKKVAAKYMALSKKRIKSWVASVHCIKTQELLWHVDSVEPA
jgi:hypothetical protein